jgi:hypothetical protein
LRAAARTASRSMACSPSSSSVVVRQLQSGFGLRAAQSEAGSPSRVRRRVRRKTRSATFSETWRSFGHTVRAVGLGNPSEAGLNARRTRSSLSSSFQRSVRRSRCSPSGLPARGARQSRAPPRESFRRHSARRPARQPRQDAGSVARATRTGRLWRGERAARDSRSGQQSILQLPPALLPEMGRDRGLTACRPQRESRSGG